MKKRGIFLKIFLLIVLFFYQGIKAHSDIDAQQYFLENSYETDNIDNKLTHDNNSYDEDLIDRSSASGFSEIHECQKYGFVTFTLLNILFVSVWQPPKIYQ